MIFSGNMFDKIEAVIFDVDGTLVDSMWIWEDVDREFVKKYNLSTPDHFYEEIEGRSYTEVARYFIETFPQLNYTVDSIMAEWRNMVYDKYIREVPFKKGVSKFLEALYDENIKMGIATSNEISMVEDMLKARDIRKFFSSVHSACEVGAGKPSPEVYLLVASELGVNSERCLVFEDVPKGIMAGKNAGMRVCAVEDDFSEHQREKKMELADYYIVDYDDISNKKYKILND